MQKKHCKKANLSVVENIFNFHCRTSTVSYCVPRTVVRVSVVWRGKMSQCHLLNQWANVLQQADALQLSPSRAELSFQSHLAAPVHLPATHASPWARSRSDVLRVRYLPEHALHRARAHAVQKSQPQPCKPRKRQLTRAGALQELVTQPLSRCHRTSGPQLYIWSRQCWSGMTFGFALFSFPRTKTLLHVLAVLPTTLPQHHFSRKAAFQRGEKVMSKTASLSLLNRRQLRAYRAIPKFISQWSAYLQLIPQNPLIPPTTHSTPETKLESLWFCP